MIRVIEGAIAVGQTNPIRSANLHDGNASLALLRSEHAPDSGADRLIRDQAAASAYTVNIEWDVGERSNPRTASAAISDDRIRRCNNDVFRWRAVLPTAIERSGRRATMETRGGERNDDGHCE